MAVVPYKPLEDFTLGVDNKDKIEEKVCHVCLTSDIELLSHCTMLCLNVSLRIRPSESLFVAGSSTS